MEASVGQIKVRQSHIKQVTQYHNQTDVPWMLEEGHDWHFQTSNWLIVRLHLKPPRCSFHRSNALLKRTSILVTSSLAPESRLLALLKHFVFVLQRVIQNAEHLCRAQWSGKPITQPHIPAEFYPPSWIDNIRQNYVSLIFHFPSWHSFSRPLFKVWKKDEKIKMITLWIWLIVSHF